MNRNAWISGIASVVLASGASAATVSTFGDNGWYSATTRNGAGTTLLGTNNSHQSYAGRTAGHDSLIANQIKFVEEGSSPSGTGNPTSVTGT